MAQGMEIRVVLVGVSIRHAFAVWSYTDLSMMETWTVDDDSGIFSAGAGTGGTKGSPWPICDDISSPSAESRAKSNLLEYYPALISQSSPPVDLVCKSKSEQWDFIGVVGSAARVSAS